MVQSKNPFLDEFAKLSANALSLAQAAGDEARAAFQSQADRFIADFDLVRRDELEALKDEIASLRAEIAGLKAANTPPAPKPSPRKPAAAKPAAKESGAGAQTPEE